MGLCRCTLMLCAAIAWTALTARATIMSYDNRAAYNAATSGNASINFAEFVPAGQTLGNFSSADGLSADGVTFLGPTSDLSNGGYFLYAVDPSYTVAYQGFNGNPTSLQGPSGGGTNPGAINITLPAGATAFAFDAFTEDNATDSGGPGLIDVVVNGQTYVLLTPNKPDLGFIGLTSTLPFSTVTISEMGNELFPDLVDFTIGSITPVPEPTCIAVTLVGLALIRRRPYRLRHHDLNGKSAKAVGAMLGNAIGTIS